MKDYCIIGAGMTGLFLAKYLRDLGSSVIILEKSRGVGGRVANRRFAGSAFDTGAQLIRCRSIEFRREMEAIAHAGGASFWFTDPEGNPVYKGAGKMTTIAKELAKGSEIHNGFWVDRLIWDKDLWRVESVEQSIVAKNIVFTSPVPQTLSIFKNSKIELDDEEARLLQGLQYRMTLVLIGIAKRIPDTVRKDYQKIDGDNAIEVIINNDLKGVTDIPNSVTVHFNASFSAKYFDQANEAIHKAMLEATESYGFEWSESEVKKWRYSEPLKTFGQESYVLCQYKKIFLGGDAFGGGSVEGAWRSACSLLRQAADQ